MHEQSCYNGGDAFKDAASCKTRILQEKVEAKQEFDRKKLKQLELFQPKCQRLTFHSLCRRCDKYANDAEFDDCMMNSSTGPFSAKAKRICLRDSAEALAKYLPGTKRRLFGGGSKTSYLQNRRLRHYEQ